MSSGNPVLDVIDKNTARVDDLAKRVAEMSKAVAGANPAAVRQAAQDGAAAAVRELTAATGMAVEASRIAADAREEFRAGRLALMGWTALSALLIGSLMGSVLGWSIRGTYFKPPGFCAEPPVATKDAGGNPVTVCVTKR